jgi:hypothetical protein
MCWRQLLLALALVSGCENAPREPLPIDGRGAEVPPPPAPRSRAIVEVLESPTMDWAEAEMFARSRAAQLAYCYQQHGLVTDSVLTGRVELWLHVAAFRIDTMAIVSRDWGRGTGDATEACVLERLRGWRWLSPRGSLKLRIDFLPT